MIPQSTGRIFGSDPAGVLVLVRGRASRPSKQKDAESVDFANSRSTYK
jgi:hypothetical protein